MFTLKSYKDQVYNIGSPSPNPNSSPLKSLPKLPEKDFVISPSKVTLRPKRNKESKCLSRNQDRYHWFASHMHVMHLALHQEIQLFQT